MLKDMSQPIYDFIKKNMVTRPPKFVLFSENYTRERSPLKKGEVSVQLTSSYLLVRNRLRQENLGIFFSFSKQPNPNQ